MQIYNNIGENNNQFVARTTETNKEGIHLIITKSQLTSNNGSWEINYNISNDNNDYIGHIILKHSSDDNDNEAEIEYYSNPEFKNKGNITIALKETLKDVFNKFSNLDNVYLNIAPSNIASQKVAINCGFKRINDSKRYYAISRENVMTQTSTNDKKQIFTNNDSNIKENKLNKDLTQKSITLKDLLDSNNESLLIILLNTITDKTLLQEWLNKDPRARYLIYKININKLLQYNLLIPNSILNDDNFPCYLIKSVINKTESLIDIRSCLYKFQSINTEFYEKLLLEYKKYINSILNSYDYNTEIFNFYFNSSSDNYLLPKELQEKLKNSDEKQKITILKEETSFKLSEIIVDSIFEDNIYNVKLNLNEIIRYTGDINVNLISPEHLNFYKIILNIDSLSNEEKFNLYNNFKDKNITSMLYDDLKILKEYSYSTIKNSLTSFNSESKLKNTTLSEKCGVDIYSLNGEPFYMLVKSMNPISNNDNNNYINLEEGNFSVERGCYSLIGSDNIDVFNKKFVYGFYNFNIQNIISVFESDCFSQESDEPILNQNYGTTAVNRLMTPSQIVNGLDLNKQTRYSEIQILGKLKPDFIVVFDSINETALYESKALNIPIVVINTLAYSNDKKRSKPFDNDDLQYIDFSGERETSLRGKR